MAEKQEELDLSKPKNQQRGPVLPGVEPPALPGEEPEPEVHSAVVPEGEESEAEQALVHYSTLPVDLKLRRDPVEILQEAHEVAKELQKMIDHRGLAVAIGESEHLKIEAWMSMAQMFNVKARLREDRFIEMSLPLLGGGVGNFYGYEATAEAVDITNGQVISVATMMCTTEEDTWRCRPKYKWEDEVVNGEPKRVRKHVGDDPVPLFQIRSMAQTRAFSKVLALCFRWVAVLAGYDPTPAEEMTGKERNGKSRDVDEGQAPDDPQRKSKTAGKDNSNKNWIKVKLTSAGAFLRGPGTFPHRLLIGQAGKWYGDSDKRYWKVGLDDWPTLRESLANTGVEINEEQLDG